MLKKLKSIFIIEEADNAEVNKSKSAKSKKSTQKPLGRVYENLNTIEGKPKEKFVNILLEAINKNNMEGFDYLEYKQSLQSLKDMKMDEATRFKSAFVMASTMGVDKAKLVSSVKHYINVLKEEEIKFNQALDNQKSQRVGKRHSDLKSLKDGIIQNERKIQELQKQNDKSKAKLVAIDEEISKAKAKMEETKSGFYGSYRVVFSQMEEDLKKINQYL